MPEITEQVIQIRAERTRQSLMRAAYDEIRHRGFRAASLSDILRSAKATKGALYYHFSDKRELGLAASAYHIREFLQERWIEPLERSDDPITTIEEIIDMFRNEGHAIMLSEGCPILNIGVEMSPIDHDFRNLMQGLLDEWRGALVSALKRGKVAGNVRPDVDEEEIAVMQVSNFWGALSQARVCQDPQYLERTGKGFLNYLKLLRP